MQEASQLVTKTMFMIMAVSAFQYLALFFSKLLHLFHEHFRFPKINRFHDNYSSAKSQLGFKKFHSLEHRQDLENHVLIFHAETVLLRSSSSLFPYFMLVAFEAGSPIRALVLFLLYPFIANLFSEDLALKAMAMICFLGLKKERFIEGRAVLPKFFLEDVGRESFEVLRRGHVAVAVSDLPQVMVESFLTDYLGVDFVVGRDLKVFCGYFVGLMEERRDINFNAFDQDVDIRDAIGVIGCLRKCSDCEWFSHCKEIYLVSEEERSNWHELPRHSYPNPLIFHDGRLASRPTFLATLAIFTWLPIGFSLAIIRITAALILPPPLLFPLFHFTGAHLRLLTTPPKPNNGGVLYVCNHRTLLDPLLISYCLNTPLTTVVYSLSRVSEILSPIKTARLTRRREKDAELMRCLLSEGSVVVCPEGTTVREPYLLRFSPLFAEISEEVVPVAMDCRVDMFYGTTARGWKSMDAVFLLMNPRPSFEIRFLGKVSCGSGRSRFEVADLVQQMIGEELGFACTKLTRRDKYLFLAGNEGVVQEKGIRT